jgi:hypothetical protein
MIEIQKVNTSVRLEVSGKWPLSKTYYFYWECNNEDFANLLTENIRSHMQNELQRIRREAYDHGWKDAKSKKGSKETWFSSIWKMK